VTLGIFASVFSLFDLSYLLMPFHLCLGHLLEMRFFSNVFGATAIAVGASMMAYLLAQYVDIYVYHFWKKVTKGKHLWLRNNFSTFCSQFVDTLAVVFLLCVFNELEWSLFGGLLLSGFLFKALIALLDTPLLYLSVYLFRKKFNLKQGEKLPDSESF